MDKLPENAKEIPSFPGYYATSTGEIWSGPKKKGRHNGKFLSPILDKDRYLCVTLFRDNKSCGKKIHRLILEAFIGPCPKGLECRHLDGNPQNNMLKNLCWGTKIENQADKLKHGTANYGEQRSQAKLNSLQVRIIRHLLKTDGFTLIEIGKIFGVTHGCISGIKSKRTWQTIT